MSCVVNNSITKISGKSYIFRKEFSGGGKRACGLHGAVRPWYNKSIYREGNRERRERISDEDFCYGTDEKQGIPLPDQRLYSGRHGICKDRGAGGVRAAHGGRGLLRCAHRQGHEKRGVRPRGEARDALERAHHACLPGLGQVRRLLLSAHHLRGGAARQGEEGARRADPYRKAGRRKAARHHGRGNDRALPQ